MSPRTIAWNDETIATLRAMFEAGDSASTIGRALGCTRSAVIGKLHRLGFHRQVSTGTGVDAAGPSGEPRAANESRRCGPRTKASGEKPVPARRHPWRATVAARKGRGTTEGAAGAGLNDAPAIDPEANARETIDPDQIDAETAGAAAHGVLFMALGPRDCRYPLWRNGTAVSLDAARFCGEETALGESYCPACCARVYTRPEVRSEQAARTAEARSKAVARRTRAAA